MSGKSAEQQARDLLEQCGVEDAQSFTAGDVVVLANFIADAHRRVRAAEGRQMDDVDTGTVEGLIAGAIAYKAGHIAALDSHREQAQAVLTALHHNGYRIRFQG